MGTIYYETIKFKTICKNNSWRMGGYAKTNMSLRKNGGLKIYVEQYGKTFADAIEKLCAFLSDNDRNEIECIGKFDPNTVTSKVNFDWTDDKVIDFVNWYVELHKLGTRYKLENQTIIESFKNGDKPSIWHKNEK